MKQQQGNSVQEIGYTIDKMKKPVILTGIRSNEEPTLANYLGAFLPIINLQREYAGQYQINMFVPDLHSFTTPINHSLLYQNTINNLKIFIASGLDIYNEDTFIYRQSHIPAHSELTWILDCFTYVGEMQRMTQFKDKSSEHSTSVTMGLMNYPVLMAADILLYNARHVPVGEDQFQHLEITRDIALRFNNRFGQEIFTVPDTTADQMKFIQRDNGLRIRSLSDPTKKMSKSSQDDKSKILLSDSSAEARKKIMSATTDSIGVINFNWDTQPGIANLLQILALLSGREQSEVNQEWVGRERYGDLKKAVANVVCDFLEQFHERMNTISDEELTQKLSDNEQKMAVVANETLFRVQQVVGLRK